MKHIFVVLCFLSYCLLGYTQNLTQDKQNKVNELLQQNEQLSAQNKQGLVANNLIIIGNIYLNANVPKEAIKYYEQAFSIVEKTNNSTALINICNQLGYVYTSLGEYSEAEKYYNIAYKLILRTNKKLDIISITSNLGQSLQNQKKYQQAIVKYEEALSIALELDNLELAKNLSTKIALCYKEINDQANFVKYYNMSAMFEKKIAEQQINKKQQELILQQQLAKQNKLKLELEEIKNKQISDSLKRQQDINEQNKLKIEHLAQQKRIKELEIKEKEQQIAKRTTIISSLIGFIIILFVGIVLILSLLRKIKKQNKDIETKNEQLVSLNKELNSKNELLSKLNLELNKSNAELAKKNKQIEDSINYAKRIQNAILPIQAEIEANFPESFILYMPRDIVSGDFYWFYKQGDIKLLSVIDCTGHSVPGALMSLIANTLLNEVFKTLQIFELDKALEIIDKKLIDTLHVDTYEDLADGMDITIYKFFENQDKAEFIASGHSSYIFINDNSLLLEGSNTQLGGTFGITKNYNFKVTELNVTSGTVVYLYSDGFIDQFNEKGQRYSTQKFKQTLNQIYKLPLKEQKEYLLKEYQNWSNGYRQIDDILIIGIKL